MAKDVVMEAFEEAEEEYIHELTKAYRDIAQEAVDSAIEHGAYQNRTGNLRASNGYIVHHDGEIVFATGTPATQQRFMEEGIDGTGVIIGNSAHYGSFVESKGFNVTSMELLTAEKNINEL